MAFVMATGHGRLNVFVFCEWGLDCFSPCVFVDAAFLTPRAGQLSWKYDGVCINVCGIKISWGFGQKIKMWSMHAYIFDWRALRLRRWERASKGSVGGLEGVFVARWLLLFLAKEAALIFSPVVADAATNHFPDAVAITHSPSIVHRSKSRRDALTCLSSSSRCTPNRNRGPNAPQSAWHKKTLELKKNSCTVRSTRRKKVVRTRAFFQLRTYKYTGFSWRLFQFKEPCFIHSVFHWYSQISF